MKNLQIVLALKIESKENIPYWRRGKENATVRQCLSLFAVLCVGLALTSSAFGQDYKFTTIDYPGAAYTSLSGINSAGQVVGGFDSRPSPQFPQHGFSYDGVTFTPIDYPDSLCGTDVFSVNDNGQMVGTYNGEGCAASERGFMYDGTAFSSIEVPGTINNNALSINNKGQIVGSVDYGTLQRAYLAESSTFSEFDFPGGGTTTEAHGISDNGQIVGYFADAAGVSHGFVRVGAMFVQIDAPGSNSTVVHGVNGNLIVGAYTTADPRLFHGFVRIGSMFKQIDVPGASSTQVWAVNICGQIAGRYQDKAGASHGFIAITQASVGCTPPAVATWTLACFDSVMLSDCPFNNIQFDPSSVSTNRMANVTSPDGHASQDLLSNASATYGRLGADSELAARGDNIVGHLSYLLSYAFMDDTLTITAPDRSGAGVVYFDFQYQGAGGGDRGSSTQGGAYTNPTLWFYSGPAPQQDWTLSSQDAYGPSIGGVVQGTPIPFTFDFPFGFHAAILAQVEMHCNPSPDTGELPCENWMGTGFSNFSNVATISSIRVFNSAGDLVTNFSVTAQSGTNYGNSPGPSR